MDVQCDRPQGGIAGLFEDHRLFHMGQTQAAHLAGRMGRQQAMAAGLLHQFLAQLRGGTVGTAARVVLHRDDFFGDEAAHPGLQGEQFLGHCEIHGHSYSRLEGSVWRAGWPMRCSTCSITV
ncbi:hypothetical protein D3C76_924750 [compost metagenome]